MNLKKSILVVDDIYSIRRTITGILKNFGFLNIDEAKDGAQALTMIKNTRYGLIICDWNMPNMTGLELLKSIRTSNENYKDIPFIMLTASAEKENVVQALQDGVSGYIIKPFSAETIEGKLSEILKE